MLGDQPNVHMKQADPPKYFELLNSEDRRKFLVLRETLSSQACRNCRNKRVETFGEILTVVHMFCSRNDEDDWKRFLACGVCWYQQYFCINIRQFHLLIDKCKSSINGSLHRLHFVMVPNRVQCMRIITDAIPYLREHPGEAREWSVRELQKSVVPQCVFPYQPMFVPAPRLYSAVVPTVERERKTYPCPKLEAAEKPLAEQEDTEIPMLSSPEVFLEDGDWMFNEDGVFF